MPESRRGEWERLVLEASAEHSRGCLGAAVAAYRQLIALRPDVPEVYFHHGNALYQQSRWDEAAQAYRQAVGLRPAYAAAWANLGAALAAAEDWAEAAAACRRALDAGISPAEARDTLGLALAHVSRDLTEAGRWGEAEAAAREAVAWRPDDADGYYCLGGALLRAGRLDEAEAELRRAVALAPDRPEIHVTLAMLLLLAERYEDGWPEYEWHLPDKDCDASAMLPPRWHGEDLGGRALVIRGEQGIGDELVYFSVIDELAARGIRCFASCEPRLLPLLRRSVPNAVLFERGGAFPPGAEGIEVGARLPAAALLQLKAPSARRIDPIRPYLRVDSEIAARLRHAYSEAGRPVVGLSWWSANPDRRRASFAALKDWLPILRVPGLRFVSLQYGDHREEIAALRRETGLDVLVDDGIDATGDLDGFAAQVAAMDMVVTIDNSTALFAACLGRPALALVDSVPDFRMGRTGDRSPWYPGLRVFRQERPGDWAPVVAGAAEALCQWKDNPP